MSAHPFLVPRGFSFPPLVLVLLILAGCHEVDIIAPDDGSTFPAGQPIVFRAKSDEHVDQTRWLVDGAPAGRGETLSTSTLAPGWHEVIARLGSGNDVQESSIHVAVIRWEGRPAPWRAAPAQIAQDGATGAIWAAIPGEGAYRVDGSGGARLFSTVGGYLPSDACQALAVVASGQGTDIWLGTDKGAVRHRAPDWQTFDHAQGLPHDDIRALAVDPLDGRLWAATPQGLAVWNGQAWSARPRSMAVTALAVHGGAAWVGTASGELLRYDGQDWEVIPPRSHGAQGGHAHPHPIVSLAVDPTFPRTVWVAPEGEDMTKYRDGAWEEVYRHKDADLPTTALVVDPRDQVFWRIEAQGLGMCRGGPDGRWLHIEAAGAVSGLSAPWRAMALEAAGTGVWLATDGHLLRLVELAAPPRAIDLPDLVARPPSALRITGSGSTRELRLESATENLGDGPIHLEGRKDPRTGDISTIQHIMKDGRTVERILGGELVFHSHHGHTHLEGYATYQLREALSGGGMGRILRQAAKVSFCLFDFRDVLGKTPKTYDGCNAELQGISVGWADVYESHTAGQAIPIDGLAPGEYWVVNTLTTVLAEKTRSNNMARARVEIHANDAVTVLEEVRGAR